MLFVILIFNGCSSSNHKNSPAPTPVQTLTPTPIVIATPTVTPTPTPVSIGEIAGGIGSNADGDWISFGKTFSTVPVVVVNAYDATGKPLIAGVRAESGSRTTTGFFIKIHDVIGLNGGTPVSSGATVQWVALIPNFSAQVQVQTGYGFHYDSEEINFDNSFSSPNPIVICSAYDNTMQYPIMAAPYNISSNKFTISLKDADGIQSMAYVSYIALVPQPNYNYYKEVALVAGYTTYLNNGTVMFDLTRPANAVLCSAQKNNFAYAVAARNNSRYGFDLGILDYEGVAGTSVWTTWLALGFK